MKINLNKIATHYRSKANRLFKLAEIVRNYTVMVGFTTLVVAAYGMTIALISGLAMCLAGLALMNGLNVRGRKNWEATKRVGNIIKDQSAEEEKNRVRRETAPGDHASPLVNTSPPPLTA
tara:strand:+ start:1970 stop:2329 length:360 start_codon:yes stop_codon:yes gene_type:complete